MECEKIIPIDILVDLCSRFVINVPEEEQSDLIRICFQIELAHWFYIDFYSKNFPNKKPCGLKEFALQVFKHIPFLQPYAKNVDEVIEEWRDYKFCVPTFGAIILDEDLTHVLLVQNYKSCWGFPKGKVNKDEPPDQCAIREVYEETGFDISSIINPEEYIEATINERVIRLYIVHGVNKQETFSPKTRNEIKAIDWFPISDIPVNKKDAAQKQLRSFYGLSSNALYSAFYMVSPFVRKLRQWIFEHNNHLPHRRRKARNKSCSDIDISSTLNLTDSIAMLKKNNKGEKEKTDREDNREREGRGTDERRHDTGEGARSSRLGSFLAESNELGVHPLPSFSSITSSESAFKKFEKPTKAKRKRAKNKSNVKAEGVDLTEREKGAPTQSGGNTTSSKLEAIPSFLNFQFDLSAIIQSMNAAVAH